MTVFFVFSRFHFFWRCICTELLIYSRGGQSEKVFVLVANGLFVFMMRGEDGKVI